MGGERPTYVPRDGATPEEETAALASVFRFIIESHHRKKAARAEDDATGTEFGSVVGTSEGTGNSAGQAMLPRVRGATGQGRQQ